MSITNRFREAFKENFNVLGLATSAAVSAALLNPIPLLVGLVAEAAYLLFVPDSRWYEQRLERRHDREVERRRAELMRQTLPYLRQEMKDRFERLAQIRRDLDRQPRSEEKWYREVLRKLDYLAEKFLMFASREAQFRAYLRSIREEVRGEKERPTRASSGGREREREERRYSLEEQILGLIFPGMVHLEIRDDRELLQKREQRRREKEWPPPNRQTEVPRAHIDPWVKETVAEIQARYEKDKQSIEAMLENEQDFDTKAVIEKRLEVLQRRHEFVDKMGKILVNLNHQLELLEDTFGLISDEIRAHPPEQILADIEDVVWQANAMTQVLEQIAPYESSAMSMEMN